MIYEDEQLIEELTRRAKAKAELLDLPKNAYMEDSLKVIQMLNSMPKAKAPEGEL